MEALSDNAVLEGSLRKILGRLKRHSAAAAPFVTLLVLLLFFSIASPRFASLDNLRNILSEISVAGIIAVGLTFVVLCGEIDLSVASVANATGVIAAFFTAQAETVSIDNIPLPGAAAIVLSLAACFVMGLINAIGAVKIGIPSFIMTLAMLQIANGVCAMLTRGQIAYSVPPMVSMLGGGSIGPAPWLVIVRRIHSSCCPFGSRLHAVRSIRVHGGRKSRSR